MTRTASYIREAEIIYRRKSLPDLDDVTGLCSPADVAPVARALIGSRLTESLIVLALDARNKILGSHEVARGSVAACPVVPADVLRYPLIAGALAIIVAHNHPSGDVAPSAEDREITKRLAEASKVVGLRLLDHVIVSDRAHYSFAHAGEI